MPPSPTSASRALYVVPGQRSAPTPPQPTRARRSPPWAWSWTPARLVRMAVVLLAVGGALAAWWRTAKPIGNASSAASAPRTVAVLPFVNTGGTQTDDYFSDGLTDELAHALARLPSLRI